MGQRGDATGSRSLRADVTVVVITHDRSRMLQQALASVFAQQGGPVDVVVVDDGSRDETPALLRGVPGIRVVTHDSAQGPSVARNAGLACVRTPWVAFLDDDDVWAPDKLLVQQAALAKEPDARWCQVSAMAVDVRLRPIGSIHASECGDVRRGILAGNVVAGGGSGVYAHADTVRQVGGFDPQILRYEDWDLWIRLALAGRLIAVDRPLVGHRRHPDSRTFVPAEGGAMPVLSKYASERAELGVTAWPEGPARALRDSLVARGARGAAATSYLRDGVKYRSPRLIAGAAVSLVSPRLMSALARRAWRAQTPASWFEEVDSWLTALADPHVLDRAAGRPG